MVGEGDEEVERRPVEDLTFHCQTTLKSDTQKPPYFPYDIVSGFFTRKGIS